MLTLTVSKGGQLNESAGFAQTCVTFSNPIARDVELQRNTEAGMPVNVTTPGVIAIGE